jgi:hypothetical protein
MRNELCVAADARIEDEPDFLIGHSLGPPPPHPHVRCTLNVQSVLPTLSNILRLNAEKLQVGINVGLVFKLAF